MQKGRKIFSRCAVIMVRIVRLLKKKKNGIYECCDHARCYEPRRRVILYDTRCRKMHADSTRPCRAALRVFLPFSNLADVIYSFCFELKGWRVCTRWQVPTAATPSGLCPGITSNVTSSALASSVYPVWRNLCLPLRLSRPLLVARRV